MVEPGLGVLLTDLQLLIQQSQQITLRVSSTKTIDWANNRAIFNVTRGGCEREEKKQRIYSISLALIGDNHRHRRLIAANGFWSLLQINFYPIFDQGQLFVVQIQRARERLLLNDNLFWLQAFPKAPALL